MLEGRIGASTITPHQNRQGLLGAERFQVLRHKDGMLTAKRGLFLHDSLILTSAAILNNAALRTALNSHTIQEAYHLLQVLCTIHTHAMTALWHKGCLCLHASSLQCLVELLTLTAGYHIILLTMEDDDGRAILIDIAGSTQTEILVGLLGQL